VTPPKRRPRAFPDVPPPGAEARRHERRVQHEGPPEETSMPAAPAPSEERDRESAREKPRQGMTEG
jgi:hypothetical protein